MEIVESFGENLSELIFDNDLTPKAFADETKIDRSVIYKYLRKEILPTLPNLVLIADYFKCSIDFILGLSENQNITLKPTPPFYERFRHLLKDKNLTRYKFRQEIHFAKQSVDDWYNGKRFPTVDNLIKLAKYFNCTLDELLGRET